MAGGPAIAMRVSSGASGAVPAGIVEVAAGGLGVQAAPWPIDTMVFFRTAVAALERATDPPRGAHHTGRRPYQEGRVRVVQRENTV